ncbi:MAG TPA: hypothetical protein DDZ80_26255, partial [Cyanobacteria bacterium UBA8803]|nr:hypothetical protein [Cyanobacteria bacterium UBA8803]
NEEFTLDNLSQQRRQQQFDIVHLATHAAFPLNGSQSPYLQMWDTRVGFDELRQVQWYASPSVQLLVLSACETALGNEKAEMGFAGLAVQAGVKSALASLWQVDDLGTLTLMTEFYHQLSIEKVSIKAEALRQAQIAMLRSQVRVESGQITRGGINIKLPQAAATWPDRDLSHPYYWAGFTIIGSPW